jgi:orotate phosphoribosyltransferase
MNADGEPVGSEPGAVSAVEPTEMAQWREQLVDVVRTRGYERRDEPFTLASGRLSHDFVDGKRALAAGADLALACRYVAAAAAAAGVTFDAAGGLTMGADQFAHGLAVVCGCDWFVVRKEPKGRGTDKLLEGADISGRRVLVCEDAVSTGGSLLKAIDTAVAHDASVVGAMTLVDRGDAFAPVMAERGIWYLAVMDHRDLGIEPIA